MILGCWGDVPMREVAKCQLTHEQQRGALGRGWRVESGESAIRISTMFKNETDANSELKLRLLFTSSNLRVLEDLIGVDVALCGEGEQKTDNDQSEV